MKFIKWKIMIQTCLVCLLPVLFGLALWNRLPDAVAIHFDINNNPDNFSSKGFAVFGLPMLMAVLQVVCCIINDINAKKHGERRKFELATKWIIPVMAVVLQIATLGYAMGWNIDIRRVAAIIVGCVLIVMGNYLPKLDYVKNYDLDTEKARKINRFTGVASVIMGFAFLVSIFLPAYCTIACVVLLIPYAIICTIYGVVTVKK